MRSWLIAALCVGLVGFSACRENVADEQQEQQQEQGVGGSGEVTAPSGARDEAGEDTDGELGVQPPGVPTDTARERNEAEEAPKTNGYPSSDTY